MRWFAVTGVVGFGLVTFLTGCSDVTNPSPRQGATVQQDLVETPEGLRPRSCVHEIEDGAQVSQAGLVRRRDGSAYQLPDCKVSMPASRRRARFNFVPADTGWIEFTEVYNYNDNYGYLTANWQVPGAPILLQQTDQSYATFPGLMSFNFILQPVLSYQMERVGPEWAITSWKCDTGPGCIHSGQIGVNPKDQLLGTVVASGCTSNLCTWTVTTRDLTTGQSTVLTVQDTPEYYRVTSGAVEASHSLSSCDEYPPNDVAFTNVDVKDQSGIDITPSAWPSAIQSGLSPSCNFNVVATQTTTTLYHNPEAVTTFGPGVNTITPNCIPSIGVTCEGFFTAISASGNTITLTSGTGAKGTITLTGATASGSFTASGGSCGLQQCTTPIEIASISGNGTNVITVTDSYSHTGHITLTGGTALSSGIAGAGWIHALGSNAIIQNDANGTTHELVLK